MFRSIEQSRMESNANGISRIRFYQISTSETSNMCQALERFYEWNEDDGEKKASARVRITVSQSFAVLLKLVSIRSYATRVGI